MEDSAPPCVWDRDEVPIIIWALADVITEVRALRADLTEDDGWEEEEDEP